MWRTALRVSCLGLRGQRWIYRPVRLPILPPPAQQPCVRREYSSRGPDSTKMFVINIPNPFIWLRTRIHFFIIRTFLDQDFNLQEFNDGARQAFVYVSRLLSQEKYDALENLVAKEVLDELKEKCSGLSEKYKESLAVNSDEILYTFPEKIGLYYEKNGRKFVNILVCFWYSKNSKNLDLQDHETDIFGVLKGFGNAKDKDHMLKANYEFHREFTQGVKPEWTITHIEHSKL